MKNLRKVLALVLVVASLMGMAVMTNAAFTDADKISQANGEAVEILAALKIIDGYTDGSYQPTKTVTRAEMAKMIATIMNSGKDINNLYKASCTFADAKDHWAAGYIGYCASMGIINGKSETTFAPNAEVTGVEAAKMILCALGYSAETEGLTGTAWAGNTLNLAAELDLFARLMAEPAAAMTREAAAQILFNGLNKVTVKYVGGSTVTVAGITFVQGGVLTPNAETLLAKKFPTVTVESNYYDKWYRPGSKYTIGSTEKIVMDTADVTGYGGGVALKDIYKVVGINGKDMAAEGVTVNVHASGFDVTSANAAPYLWTIVGAKKGDTTWNGVTAVAATKDYAGMTSTATTKIGSNADYTEVYWDEAGKVLDVLVFWSGPAKVDTYTLSSDKKTATVKTAAGFGYANLAEKEIVLTVADTKITKEFADNKTVVIGYCAKIGGNSGNYELFDLQAANVVTVTSEGYVGSYETLYAGGKTYSADNNKVISAFAYGEEYDLYLDAGNKVYYAEAYNAVVDTKYAYVLDTAKETATFGDETFLAKVLFADGVEEIVETKADYAALEGEIVTYGVTKEVYEMVKVEDNADEKITVATATAVTNKAPAVGAAIANSKALFVVDHAKDADKADYAVYTGIANVPSFTGSVKYVAKDGKVVIAFALNTEASTASGVALSQAVLYKTGSEKVQAFEKSYYNVAAIIDGKVTTVKVDATEYATLTKAKVLYFTQGVKDGDIYTDITASENLAGATSVTSFVKYADGVVTVNGTAYFTETGVPAYVYGSKATAGLKISTIEKLTNSFKGFAVIDANGVITALYGTDAI